MSLSDCPCGGTIALGPEASNKCDKCGKGVFGKHRKCNREACQSTADTEWHWNFITRAWYCLACAERINLGATHTLATKLCISEHDLP